MDSNPGKTSTENINEVILRLLKLETGIELDYQTYAKKLKIKLASSRMVGVFIPAEEDILLREEFKRVRNKEGRFVILKSKKTKVSSPPPPPRSGGGSSPKTGSIVKAKSGKITADNYYYQNYVEPVNVKDVTKKTVKVSKQTDPLTRISDTLDSILNTLTNINKFDREQSTRQRTDAENRRRGQRETDLESKRFEGIKKAVSTITKPFQSIWDRIVNFITNVILGRIIIKLLDWLANPKNQEKAKSIIRFLGDWWPALLGSYVLFGTTFGKFIRGATGMVGRFILHIGKVAIPQLLKFIKTPLGAGIALFTAGATIPAMFPGTVNEQERKTTKAPGSTEDKIKALQQQKANLNVFEKLQGKGSEIDEQISLLETGKTKSYRFSGGGFANFGKMFGGNSISTLLGSEGEEQKSNGFVSGQSGVDKVPAMLTDGEFVMSTGAVQKYGVDTLEAMNAAGGGTNKPKIMGGKTYAVGGGRIGDVGDSRYSVGKLRDDINKFLRETGGGGGSNFDIGNPKTWKMPGGFNNKPSLPSSRSGTPTGSLMNDPLGAISRMTGGSIPKPSGSTDKPSSPSSRSGTPTASLMNDPLGAISRMTGGSIPKPSGSIGIKMPEPPKLVKEVFNNIDSAPFRDAASAFIKHNLGGHGGPLSEVDLSNASRSEIKKAIERAKKRTSTEIRKAEQKIKELQSSKTPQGKIDLAVQQGFLKRLKEGAVRVQYTDYYNEDKKLTKDARNAQLILGQFWAHARDKKEGGGYRIEDKYDFNYMTKTDPKTKQKRDMTNEELLNEVLLGKNKTLKQRLQAIYLMNPLKGKGDVDMVLGGNRTASETAGLAGSRTLLGGMLGMSGKSKDKNTQALEAKRPWYDKMGMFGGASAKIKEEQNKKSEFLKKNPGTKLYDKPQKNTKEPYKSKFIRPSKLITPVKPIPKPKPKPIVAGGGMGGRRGSRSRPSSGSNSPSFNAQHSKGTFVSSSAYGIMR